MLFALSGNICAFPKCNQRMVNDRKMLVGVMCHIEASEKGGPRYNTTQLEEDRRDFTNLILLCPNHHTETDDVEIYTVQVLKEMKYNHEIKYLRCPEKLSDEQVRDIMINVREDKQFDLELLKHLLMRFEEMSERETKGKAFNDLKEGIQFSTLVGSQWNAQMKDFFDRILQIIKADIENEDILNLALFIVEKFTDSEIRKKYISTLLPLVENYYNDSSKKKNRTILELIQKWKNDKIDTIKTLITDSITLPDEDFNLLNTIDLDYFYENDRSQFLELDLNLWRQLNSVEHDLLLNKDNPDLQSRYKRLERLVDKFRNKIS